MKKFKPAEAKRLARLYRAAARMIERGEEVRACYAISYLVSGSAANTCRECTLYVEEMLGGCSYSDLLYPADEFGPSSCDSQAAMDARVVALCLMAELVLRP